MAPVSDAGLQSLALVLVKESSWRLRSSVVKDWGSPDLPEGQPAQVITDQKGLSAVSRVRRGDKYRISL